MNELIELIKRFINELKFWMIIDPWDQAVRVRLGKYTKVLKGGVYFKIPVLDIFYVQSCRFRISSNADKNTVQTLDNKAVTFVIGIGYKIDDIFKLYNTLHHAEDTIKYMMRSEACKYVSLHNLVDIKLQQMTEALTQKLNLEEYGLSSVIVYITDLTYVKTYRLIGDYMYGNNGSMLSTEATK